MKAKNIALILAGVLLIALTPFGPLSTVAKDVLAEAMASPVLAENFVRGCSGDLAIRSTSAAVVQSIENGNRDEPSSPRPGCLGPDPLRVLCSNPWFGGCASLGLMQEHETIMGDETRGKRRGQSVSSAPAKKGFTFDVGLLVGARALVFGFESG